MIQNDGRTCIHCGRAVPAGAVTCPYCGADLRAWPPPVGNAPPGPPLKTGSVRGDTIQGIGVCVGLWLLCGVGLIGVPIMYFTNRPQYPIYARAMGWAYIACLVLVFGGFAACTFALTYSLSHQGN